MAKPIILADDPEPEPEPPPEPVTLWVVRYLHFGNRSVMCDFGDREKNFYSDRPVLVVIFESREEATTALHEYLRDRTDGVRDYAAEPLDALPQNFLAEIRAANPYFNKEIP